MVVGPEVTAAIRCTRQLNNFHGLYGRWFLVGMHGWNYRWGGFRGSEWIKMAWILGVATRIIFTGRTLSLETPWGPLCYGIERLPLHLAPFPRIFFFFEKKRRSKVMVSGICFDLLPRIFVEEDGIFRRFEFWKWNFRRILCPFNILLFSFFFLSFFLAVYSSKGTNFGKKIEPQSRDHITFLLPFFFSFHLLVCSSRGTNFGKEIDFHSKACFRHKFSE